MNRLFLSVCLLLSLSSYSLASTCKEAQLCCVSRSENCLVKKSTVATVGEELADKGCYCDLACLKNEDCCPDFKTTCGVESRPYRYHNLIKRDASHDMDFKPRLKDDKDDDDYINEEGYEDDTLNDEVDDEEDGDIYDAGEEEESDGGPVVMLTKPTNITKAEGETVWLHCSVENGNDAVLRWNKGETLIYQNQLITTDNRVSIYSNWTLSIKDLKKSDYGSYKCSAIDSKGEIHSVVHRLLMPQAPRVVQMLPINRERYVPEGKPVKIQCLVTGEPKPKITWSREGSRLTDQNADFGDQTLYIKSVNRHDSGKYQCLATNGIGSPAVGKVTINVLHSPDVHIKKSVVNTDDGYEATMVCTVNGKPSPTIAWEKDSQPIHNSHHHEITIDEDRTHSTLKITKVTPEDFGKYICAASNDYGQGRGHVTLVKQPARALLISENEADGSTLQWAIESVQPITDVELRVFKVDPRKPNGTNLDNNWTEIKPDIDQANGNVYTIKHNMNELAPGRYAAQIRAKNTHGWSDLSDHHYFDRESEDNEISGRLYDETPVLAGIGMATGSAPSLEGSKITTLFISTITCILVRFI